MNESASAGSYSIKYGYSRLQRRDLGTRHCPKSQNWRVGWQTTNLIAMSCEIAAELKLQYLMVSTYATITEVGWGRLMVNTSEIAMGARLAEFDGRDIRDSHGSRIATIDDVKKSIEGIGGSSLVAMWLFFVR